MKLLNLTLPTKSASRHQADQAAHMEKQTEPLHLSRTVDIYPDFTPDCLRVRINAHQLDNGRVVAYVEDILNRTTKQYLRDPYTEELRDAVRDALTTYFEDAAFTRYFITDTKVYF